MAASNSSMSSAKSRNAWRLPAAQVQQLWIIRKALVATWRSSPARKITEAAEAARPSTLVVTFLLCSRRRLRMAMPSNMSPPGELM
ncbi:hypothetical protein D9M70_491600 [compost metagenome]